jgi:hypothetical protein
MDVPQADAFGYSRENSSRIMLNASPPGCGETISAQPSLDGRQVCLSGSSGLSG